MPEQLNSLPGEPEVLPIKPPDELHPTPPSPNAPAKAVARKRPGRLLGVWDYIFGKERKKSGKYEGSYEEVLEQAQKYPENASLQLKLAEVYQRKGQEEKAIAKFFQAAEAFRKEKFLAQAMAIYKRIIAINPHLIHANLRMAEAYREMGYFSDALAQYRIVAKHYEEWGKKELVPGFLSLIQEIEKEKALREKVEPPGKSQVPLEPQGTRNNLYCPEAMAGAPGAAKGSRSGEGIGQGFDLLAELAVKDPAGFDDPKEISTERTFGFEAIFKEIQAMAMPAEAYPDFHLQMGKACMEMGFNDGAIEHLLIAMEKGQKPAQAANLLSKCYREKGWLHEARMCYEKAMEFERNRQKEPSTPSPLSHLPSS
ncbi:MAG: hypothetical protein HXY45_17335 [Syntrophaceae bacterium]|nr:hypothetical protein [Syntrophaceae bacterium]